MTTLQNNTNLQERLNSVFRSVFNDDDITISAETTAADIDAWDSLMHITLIVNVESEFGVRLNASEVGRLKNVGSLLAILEQRSTK